MGSLAACCFFLEEVVSLMNRNWWSWPDDFLEDFSMSFVADVCLLTFLSGETSMPDSLRFFEVDTDLDWALRAVESTGALLGVVTLRAW